MLSHSVRFCACLSVLLLGSMFVHPVAAHEEHELNDDLQAVTVNPGLSVLQEAFESASAKYEVPVELLQAVAFVESRWVHTGPTIDQGYGIMHLVENGTATTLSEAADLTGYSIEELKADPIANIYGAAALIAQYAGNTVGKPAGMSDYREALRIFTGLHESVRDKQVMEYYRVLTEGAEAVNRHGKTVELNPVDEEIDFSAFPHASSGLRSSDYGPAIWDPADSSNYTVGRSAAIDRWVNHWVGVGTYAGAISWFKNSSANVSAHFVIRQSDGELTQMVRIANKAWHCGNWNSRSIGIEHEATPDYPWPTSSSAPMLVNSATCCAYFCDQYGIPKTRTYIVGHNEVPGSATSCPGPLPWTTYMNLVTGSSAGPEFVNALVNGGFEDDMDSWSNGSSTTTQILASGAHGGSKACRFYRSDGGYATIWQNPYETTGQVWRTTCWAYRQTGMTNTGFGFKDQSGNTEAYTPISATTWQFHSVDWTIADDIDSQAWGSGSTGIVIDDVRCGLASKMNWITSWIWNGPHASNISTDYFAGDGGEQNIYPDPGEENGGYTWTTVSRSDGFIDLDEALGGASNCVTYAHVYVTADSIKTDVNLLVGSDDGIKIFLNGVAVHTNDVSRAHDYFSPDDDVISGLILNAGENRLLIKVRESTGAYTFSARFCDDDGYAISGLSYSVTGSGPQIPDIIIESRPGGQNTDWYSEEGEWADSSVSCTTPGVTQGIGSRYGSTFSTIAGIKRAYFEPQIPVAGQWEVYTTWPAANYRRSPILHRIHHAEGITDVEVDQTVNNDTWYPLGTYTFGSDSGAAVRISNDTIDLSGSMYAAAVKFVFVEEDPLADYKAFASCLSGPGVDTPPVECSYLQFERADYDQDGAVDLADFAILSIELAE